MKVAAAKGKLRPGVVLHVGDSITYASPYAAWARAGEGRTESDRAALKWMHAGAGDDTDGWYLATFDHPDGGRSHTACGGIRSDEILAGGKQRMPPLDELLEKYKPQAVVVMLGTNDASAGRVAVNRTLPLPGPFSMIVTASPLASVYVAGWRASKATDPRLTSKVPIGPAGVALPLVSRTAPARSETVYRPSSSGPHDPPGAAIAYVALTGEPGSVESTPSSDVAGITVPSGAVTITSATSMLTGSTATPSV